MTKERIYNLAWNQALTIWQEAEKAYNENPNELTKLRVQRAWQEQEELHDLILKESNK